MTEFLRRGLTEPYKEVWLNKPSYEDPSNRARMKFRKAKTHTNIPTNRQPPKKKRK